MRDEGYSFDRLLLLKAICLRLRFARVNGLSVERLRRLGTLCSTGAPNHSVAFVSFMMRHLDYFVERFGFELGEFAKLA